MPGQTWPGAAASFLGMWVVMMVAMMLPSLVPMLWRYRQALGRTGETRLIPPLLRAEGSTASSSGRGFGEGHHTEELPVEAGHPPRRCQHKELSEP
jgi:hypothetical protein